MKRTFFRLNDEEEVPGRWHLGEVRTLAGEEPRLRAGLHFNGADRLVAGVSRAGRVLDFCLTSFAVPVASAALARAVSEAADGDVQCLPVEVASQAGMVVLNAVRVVRCLDESNSEFIKWTAQDHRADLAGQYRQVTKLILDEAAIPVDAHFFRVEGWLVALIVSEQVKDAMERAGCRGARFTEVMPR